MCCSMSKCSSEKAGPKELIKIAIAQSKKRLPRGLASRLKEIEYCMLCVQNQNENDPTQDHEAMHVNAQLLRNPKQRCGI